jgi:hypothetical protein
MEKIVLDIPDEVLISLKDELILEMLKNAGE